MTRTPTAIALFLGLTALCPNSASGFTLADITPTFSINTGHFLFSNFVFEYHDPASAQMNAAGNGLEFDVAIAGQVNQPGGELSISFDAQPLLDPIEWVTLEMRGGVSGDCCGGIAVVGVGLSANATSASLQTRLASDADNGASGAQDEADFDSDGLFHVSIFAGASSFFCSLGCGTAEQPSISGFGFVDRFTIRFLTSDPTQVPEPSALALLVLAAAAARRRQR
jgi:MYXO-CTERM domain-containing protein